MNGFLEIIILTIICMNLILLETFAQVVNECAKQIHQGCLDEYSPTEQEVENARIYIQDLFLRKATFKPRADPCPKMYVRRNFKCMTEEERLRVINNFKKLYENGFMWETADIHANCWVPWHKSIELIAAHRIIATKVELAMRKFDPGATLPYWSTPEDCTNPHESLIWKYFGTTGTNATHYCVTDGPFTKETADRCIKRQWNPDGTITSWFCPEIDDFRPSPSISLASFLGNVLTLHFHPHLLIGGFNGHMSQNWAPYDAIFYLHHNYYLDCALGRFQIEFPELMLTSPLYNTLWKYDPVTHQELKTDIETDKICYYNESVLNTITIGFGDQCSICDKLVKYINHKLFPSSNSPHSLLKNQLVSLLRPEMSTDMISNDLSSIKPDWWKCNPECKPMPIPPDFDSDATHRRTLKAYIEDWNSDKSIFLTKSQLFLSSLTRFLNKVPGLCSPYVTSINDLSDAKIENQSKLIEDLLPGINYFKKIIQSFKQIHN